MIQSLSNETLLGACRKLAGEERELTKKFSSISMKSTLGDFGSNSDTRHFKSGS